MAKGPTTNFSEQSAQSATQVQDWLREMMEQNLDRSRNRLGRTSRHRFKSGRRY